MIIYDHSSIKYITSCCPRLGAFSGSGEVFFFLKDIADQMKKGEPSVLFPERYKDHVAFSFRLVGSYDFLSPPPLLHRFTWQHVLNFTSAFYPVRLIMMAPG